MTIYLATENEEHFLLYIIRIRLQNLLAYWMSLKGWDLLYKGVLLLKGKRLAVEPLKVVAKNMVLQGLYWRLKYFGSSDCCNENTYRDKLTELKSI